MDHAARKLFSVFTRDPFRDFLVEFKAEFVTLHEDLSRSGTQGGFFEVVEAVGGSFVTDCLNAVDCMRYDAFQCYHCFL